ncbi:MAG: HEAT repeat domain-containing protein [Pseudanabaena sp.]
MNQLDDIFEMLGYVENLKAPIEESELVELLRNLPLQLPDYIIDLYRWHNGIDEFMPSFSLMPLCEAISEYTDLIYIAEDVGNPDFYKTTYFPIIRHQDTYFAVDCDLLTGGVYEIWVEGGDKPIKEYQNLEQMFCVIVDAYISRAFYLEEIYLHTKKGFSQMLMWNYVLFQKVKNKYLSKEQLEEKEKHWAAISHQADAFLLSRNSNNYSSIHELYGTYDERGIHYLLKFLTGFDPKTVAFAASGLGMLKARESLPELLKLVKHPDESVRVVSTSAIGEIICPEDIFLLQPLIDLLSDKSHYVQIQAIEALGKLRKLEAVDPLVEYLIKRPNDLYLIEALAKIGGSKAIEALKNYSD